MNRRLWIGAAFALPVFLLAMAHMVPGLSRLAWVESSTARWTQAAMTTPVVWWAGWPFWRRGVRSIATWNLNMVTLITIGVGAAYLFNSVAMVFPKLFPTSMRHGGMIPVYFEASAVIVVLVLLGQVLELRAHSRTGSAIKALLNLAPPTAKQVASGGDKEVPLDRVKVGDWLRVVPVDRVPVDGTAPGWWTSCQIKDSTGKSSFAFRPPWNRTASTRSPQPLSAAPRNKAWSSRR
jgi:Cu+-exporting ATPase